MMIGVLVLSSILIGPCAYLGNRYIRLEHSLNQQDDFAITSRQLRGFHDTTMTWGLRGARRRKGAISDMRGHFLFLSTIHFDNISPSAHDD